MTAARAGRAARRALLVIDMQNVFCHSQGTVTRLVGALRGIGDVVDRVSALVKDAHTAGNPVVYTRHCYGPQYVDAGRNFHERIDPTGLTGHELADQGALLSGTWDSEIIEELQPRPGDVVLDKTRFDAFLYTPLESILRRLGVEDLDVCGVVTNICVDTTVRGAFMRDFTCRVHAAGTTAPTERLREQALEAMEQGHFGEIV